MSFIRTGTVASMSALLVAALPAGAHAQASGHSTSAPLSNVKPFRELRAYGGCYARTNRKAALTLLATVPGSLEEGKAFRRLVYGEDVITSCLPGGTKMSMPTLFAR